jgi:hypothetical protein
MKMLRDPLFWLIALFVALIFWLPYSQPLFAALFPQLPRPVYQQESFAARVPELLLLARGARNFAHWWKLLPPLGRLFRLSQCWRLPFR